MPTSSLSKNKKNGESVGQSVFWDDEQTEEVFSRPSEVTSTPCSTTGFITIALRVGPPLFFRASIFRRPLSRAVGHHSSEVVPSVAMPGSRVMANAPRCTVSVIRNDF